MEMKDQIFLVEDLQVTAENMFARFGDHAQPSSINRGSFDLDLSVIPAVFSKTPITLAKWVKTLSITPFLQPGECLGVDIKLTAFGIPNVKGGFAFQPEIERMMVVVHGRSGRWIASWGEGKPTDDGEARLYSSLVIQEQLNGISPLVSPCDSIPFTGKVHEVLAEMLMFSNPKAPNISIN